MKDAPSLTEDTTEGRTECWVGVLGEESMTDAGEMSDCKGDWPSGWVVRSGSTDAAASESMVYSDGARVLTLDLTGVEVLLRRRAPAGLAVLVLGGAGGVFARIVLGWEPVVDVSSVSESHSVSRILEREASRGPACDVMRVPLSTLCLPASRSRCMASTSLRRMLLALAVLRRSLDVVAVSGGLGGARGGGGGGAALVGVGGISVASAACSSGGEGYCAAGTVVLAALILLAVVSSVDVLRVRSRPARE